VSGSLGFQKSKMAIEKKGKKNHIELIFIGIAILLFILLRIPSLFEPHWYSDEGFLAAAGNSFKYDLKLYKDIYTNMSPGLFYIFYILKNPLNLNLALAKTINLFMSIISLLLIFKITNKIFSLKIANFLLIISSFLFGLPLLETNIITEENFFLPFIMASIYLVLEPNYFKLILAGISIGIGFWFSPKVAFVFIAILIYIFFLKYKTKSSYIKVKFITSFIIGLLIPLSFIYILLYINNNLSDFYNLVIKNNISSILNAKDESLGFIIIANTIRTRTLLAFFSIVVITILYIKRKIESKYFLIYLWLISAIYSVLLYQKPYIHYLIETIPIFIIIIGIYIIKFKDSKTNHNIIYIISFILSIFLFFNLFSNGRSLRGNLNCSKYYINIFQYLAKTIDSSTYVNFFSSNTYNVYRLNSLLSQNYPSLKNVYIWTDNPWIYKLADVKPPTKYLLSYHAERDIETVKQNIIKEKSLVIIIDENSQNPQELIDFIITSGFEFEREFYGYKIFVLKEIAPQI